MTIYPSDHAEVPSARSIGASGDDHPGQPPRGRILREPTAQDIATSTITAFLDWLIANRGLRFASYAELWEWSVRDREQFWGALWDYFQIETSAPFEAVCRGKTFQDTVWFPGARLNYAQHMLRHESARADRPVLICHGEDGTRQDWTWSEFGDAIRRVATGLRKLGIKPGDRIAGYLPNIAEAAIALLAASAIGAVWSSCSPEFGVTAALDRFGQIEPRLLFAVSSYGYAGKERDRRAALNDMLAELPSVEHVVLVSKDMVEWEPASSAKCTRWESLLATPAPSRDAFSFEALPTSHPLWIVFTSGTSGRPKAIVHSHGGALLGVMKDLGFHIEVTGQSTLFFYCSTNWIVWNLMLGGLSLGACVVLYDGSPFHPDIGRLWSIAAQSGATVLGTSPGFITKMIDRDYVPLDHNPLETLETVVLAGAIAEDAVCEWLAAALPQRTRIISQAGSTEICGGYAGGVSLLPTRAGEITARVLGMDVEALDSDMQPVRGKAAELIIRSPFPNAPQQLWNDLTGERFFEAYLSEFDGMWRQGDMIAIYADGACRVTGRADATINRNGVRMGSNELYRALATDKHVADAIAVCPQAGAFDGKLLLFVHLATGSPIDDQLREDIARLIAHKLSPRHVPDLIFQTPAVPYTATGKRLEVPLRHLLESRSASGQFAMALQHDPDTAAWYMAFAQS